MRSILIALGIFCIAVVEVFFLWASFRHGFFPGLWKYFLAHINPFIVVYYLPAAFFFWLAGRFTGWDASDSRLNQ